VVVVWVLRWAARELAAWAVRRRGYQP